VTVREAASGVVTGRARCRSVRGELTVEEQTPAEGDLRFGLRVVRGDGKVRVETARRVSAPGGLRGDCGRVTGNQGDDQGA
jgi:hypothetical protein